MRRLFRTLVPTALALLLLAGPALALRGGHACSMADCAMAMPAPVDPLGAMAPVESTEGMDHCRKSSASLEVGCCPPAGEVDPVDANVSPAPVPQAAPGLVVAAEPVAERPLNAAPAPAPAVPRAGRALLSLHQTFLI